MHKILGLGFHSQTSWEPFFETILLIHNPSMSLTLDVYWSL